MTHVSSELPEGYRLRVVHLHKDNSSRKQRLNSEYRTIARILDSTDNVVVEASAKCHSELDFPSRQKGFQVAVGRAKRGLQEYLTDCAV